MHGGKKSQTDKTGLQDERWTALLSTQYPIIPLPQAFKEKQLLRYGANKFVYIFFSAEEVCSKFSPQGMNENEWVFCSYDIPKHKYKLIATSLKIFTQHLGISEGLFLIYFLHCTLSKHYITQLCQMYNSIGKQKYKSPMLLMCGLHTDDYNTVISDIVGTEKKFLTYQIYCSVQFTSLKHKCSSSNTSWC